MSEQSYDDSNMSASQDQPMAESSVGSQRTACFGTSVSTSPLTQRSQSTNQSTDISAPYNSNSVRGLAPEPRGEGSRHLTTVVEPTEPTSGTSRSYSMLNSSSCSDHTGGFLQDSTSDAPMKKHFPPKHLVLILRMDRADPHHAATTKTHLFPLLKNSVSILIWH